MQKCQSKTCEHVQNAVMDLVADFLYYDRKEDEDLPLNAIEQVIEDGEICVDEIVSIFRQELSKRLTP